MRRNVIAANRVSSWRMEFVNVPRMKWKKMECVTPKFLAAPTTRTGYASRPLMTQPWLRDNVCVQIMMRWWMTMVSAILVRCLSVKNVVMVNVKCAKKAMS